MAMFASEHEMGVARDLLRQLVDRGNRPRMLDDGKPTLGGPVAKRERDWAHTHRDAMQSAIVGDGRYVPGSLDRHCGIGGHADAD